LELEAKKINEAINKQEAEEAITKVEATEDRIQPVVEQSKNEAEPPKMNEAEPIP